MKRSLLLLFVLVPVVVACVSPVPHTPTSAPTQTPTRTATLAPTATPTWVPTATPTLTPTRTPLAGDGAIARRHLAALSDAIGQRVVGTPGEAEAARYIEAAFTRMGYAPVTQPFSFADTSSSNVIAVKSGLSNQEILVGAHYDSVPAGRGADDNASGVAVLLEVAEKIRDVPTPYTVRFVAFGAEEVGLEGSTFYVAQMGAADIENTIAMINLDSLVAGDMAYVYGDAGKAGVIRDWVLDVASQEGLDLRTQPGHNPDFPAGTTGDWSDHVPFKDAGIQYAYFESTNWNLGEKDGFVQVDEQLAEEGEIWHSEYDTIEFIDATFQGRIDRRLELFVTLLHTILTRYEVPD